MSLNSILLELITYLTDPKPMRTRNFLLSVRYEHSNHIALLADFLSLLYSGALLNIKQEIHSDRLVKLIKNMLLSADLIFTLVLFLKITPSVFKSNLTQLTKESIQLNFPQFLKFPILYKGQFSETKVLQEGKRETNKFLESIQKIGYFSFYFHLLNYKPEENKEHINSFILQVQSEQTSNFLSKQNFQTLQTEIFTQCQKLTKRKYRQEVVNIIFTWFQQEVNRAFLEQENPHISMNAKQILFRVVKTSNNLACSTLIQVMNKALLSIPALAFNSFLSLIDQLIVSGNTVTAVYAVMTFPFIIFSNLIKKTISVQFELIGTHFYLWKQAMQKRSFKSNLLMCLNLWLPLIFDKQPLSKHVFHETMQLFREPLLKLHKNSKLSAISHTFQEIELRKIEQVYKLMQPFHDKLEDLEDSINQEKYLASFKKVSQLSFDFNVSEASQQNQIKSLMQSLKSSKSVSEVIPSSNQQEQLRIYSKRHSLYSESAENISNWNQNIDEILNALQLLQHQSVSSSLSYAQEDAKYAEQKIQFLPISSKQSQLKSKGSRKQSQHQLNSNINDIFNRDNVKLSELTLTLVPIHAQQKKKIIKNRGVIIKTNWLQVDFLIDSLLSRRRISLFFTFFKQANRITFKIKEKSIKFWKKIDYEFKEPKIKEQLKTTLDIENIKLYELKGISNSHRLIRPQLQLQIIDHNQQIFKEIYEIPVYLYNLVEWTEISEKQGPIFDQDPQLTSLWLPLCQKIKKNRQSQLFSYFPFLKIDSKGNALLKFHFLIQVIFAKLYFVMHQVRVVLINSKSEIALMAILEMVCSQKDHLQS